MKIEKRIIIPCIVSVEKAVQIYDERPRLRNGDVMELFGCGLSKARQLRAYVEQWSRENGITITGDPTVKTGEAFRAWYLDIDDLRQRLNNILKYRKKVAG